ncbi:MAG: tetratricopeptide repeat protein [Candidatus Mcinerneyibacterium aminivorans]|uniref:Tetratricopeptide repeat protein n=1 Tax=Candidatus Mcinerneyibacterium aminivorans TaxID=2703815 RepID=A0A5D0MBA3_9BACT|nr:MAG: tetratricopeptide repeat protein [Candidatus Mcinerneyibacterium aminivorans]
MKKIVYLLFIVVLVSGCTHFNKNIRKESSGTKVSEQEGELYIEYLKLKEKNERIHKRQEILQKLLKRHPESDQLKKDLIEVSFEMQKYKKALGLVNNLINKFPEDINLYYKKAQIIQAIGDFPEDVYIKIEELSSQTIYVQFKLAEYYYKNKEYKKAFKYYYKIYEEKHNLEIFKRLIFTGFKIEKYKEIYDITMKYKDLKSTTNDELIRYLIASNEINKIIKFLKINYSKMEYNFKAKLYFTLYYKFDKKNHLEKKKLDLIKNGLPKNEVNMFLAYYYLENKKKEDDEKSIQILQNLIAKGYENDDVYQYVFNYYIKNNQYNKLKQLYLKKRERIKDESIGVRILYQLMKSNNENVSDFFELMDWKKIKNKYLFSFFYGTLELKEYKKADELIKKIPNEIIDQKNLFDYYFLKMQIKSNVNDYEKMKYYFEKAVKLEPNNANLLNYYGYSLLLMDKNYDKALGYLKKAYEESPQNAAINDSLGWAYFKLGNMEKAVKYINFSLNKIPDDPEVLYHKARIEEYYNRLNNALMYLERAKKNNKGGVDYVDIEAEIKRIKNIIDSNN